MTKIEKIEIRVDSDQKNIITERSKKYGFSNVSEFIRIISIYGKLNFNKKETK